MCNRSSQQKRGNLHWDVHVISQAKEISICYGSELRPFVFGLVILFTVSASILQLNKRESMTSTWAKIATAHRHATEPLAIFFSANNRVITYMLFISGTPAHNSSLCQVALTTNAEKRNACTRLSRDALAYASTPVFLLEKDLSSDCKPRPHTLRSTGSMTMHRGKCV